MVEKKMKRMFSMWAGLAAIALLPALAQQPTGKIHGRVTNPVGTPTTKGSVSLSSGTSGDGPGLTSKQSEKYRFTLSETGEYSGDVAPGTYTVIYRDVDTPQEKLVDELDNVKVVSGQDVVADVDMSRQAYIDKLTPDQKKQLADLKKNNEAALKSNAVIKSLNADILTVNQDLKDADLAHAAALKELGAAAPKDDLKAKEEEIRTAKYTEIETLMLKDTPVRSTEPILWLDLAEAQSGLKKYDDAEPNFKKALDLDEKDPKKLNPAVEGGANEGLGTVYARTGKVPEANAAFDTAAKANPPGAGNYLKNEAVIFYQTNNADAQAAAADEAITAINLALDHASPAPDAQTVTNLKNALAVSYYLKGAGLVGKATEDSKTHLFVAPPGCLEAYQKYLELDPTGPYSQDAKDVLTGFGQKIVTTYNANKKK